jgi:hypothetical protein
MRMDGRPRVDDEGYEGIDILRSEDNLSEQMKSSGVKPGPADNAAALQRRGVVSKGFENMVRKLFREFKRKGPVSDCRRVDKDMEGREREVDGDYIHK